MKIERILIFIIVLIGMGCVEEYPPPVADGAVDFLVVDGSINSTTGSVEVILTRAIALDSQDAPPPELNAQLQIEDDNGMVYSLGDYGSGVYRKDNFIIEDNTAYRLSIKRADGRTYYSEYVSMKNTPPIDSIVWSPSRLRDEILIQINTHDDANNTRYYQWTFEETYEYTSPFLSLYKYENGMVVDIPREDYVNRCWKSLLSTKIIIASSEELNNDIISNFVVHRIPVGSQELSIKYSILVKQRALTNEAYTYWLNLQQTTENLGGLFDPQPGRVNGNISSVSNPNEPVIGYFDIAAIQEKRIFIASTDLPSDLRTRRDLMGCTVDSVSVQDVGNVGQIGGLALVGPIEEGVTIVGYTYSRIGCTDCRLQGGALTKPLFWE